MRRARSECDAGVFRCSLHLLGQRPKVAMAAVVVVASLLPHVAGANTELPSPYDARSVGMGGSGVAHVHNGASIYHNPAALHEVKNLAVTVSVSPAITGQSAPVDGPQTTVSADTGVLPLFLVGAAYRVGKRLAIGAAYYPTGGFGSTYNNLASLGGLQIKGEVATSEFSPVVTYSILGNLAVSLGYRLTLVSERLTMPTASAGGGPRVAAQIDLSGASFLGLQAGVYVRPMERLRLGAVYRSKVTTRLTGSTTVEGAEMDTSMEMSCPHAFKVGAAFDVVPNRLLLALDFKYQLYSESSKEMVTKTRTPAGEVTSTQRLDWKNVFSGYFGVELLATPKVPIRLGYLLTTSATPASRPSPLMMPPGIDHGPTAGAGVRLAHVALDVGVLYSWANKDVAASDLAVDAGVAPGQYSSKLLIIAASAT